MLNRFARTRDRVAHASMAASALLASCAAPAPPAAVLRQWTTYQMDATHNAVVSESFAPVRWTLRLPNKINGGLAYDGKRLFAVDFAKELVAIDPHDGRVIWRARGDDVLMSTPIVAEGLVYVGSGTNAVMTGANGQSMWGRSRGNHWYAFRADNGRLAWSYATTGEAMPSAAYVGGSLLFGTGDGVATSLRASTGRKQWTAPLPGHVSMASAVVANDLVYFVTTRDEAHHFGPWGSQTVALDWRTGKRVWAAPYGNADCTPTIFGNRLFVEGVKDGPLGAREAIGSNDVSALDPRSGSLRWRHFGANGFYSSVGTNERGIAGTYANGTLFQSLPATNRLTAFGAGDGRIRWSIATSGPVKMSPIVLRGRVYVGDTSGMFYAIDERSGRIVRTLAFAKPFTSAPFVTIGQTMFVPQNDTLRAVPIETL